MYAGVLLFMHKIHFGNLKCALSITSKFSYMHLFSDHTITLLLAYTLRIIHVENSFLIYMNTLFILQIWYLLFCFWFISLKLTICLSSICTFNSLISNDSCIQSFCTSFCLLSCLTRVTQLQYTIIIPVIFPPFFTCFLSCQNVNTSC